MLKKYIFLWLLLGLFCAAVSAQKADYYHRILTFDGKEYEGEIVNFRPGDLLHIRLADGEEIFLAADAVKRINYISPMENQTGRRQSQASDRQSKERATIPVRTKDWMVQIGSGLSFGPVISSNFNFRENTFGYMVSLSVLRQIVPQLQVGAGLDYTSFNPANRENALGLFGRLRGMSSNRQKAFFLQTDAGYSQPTVGATEDMIERSGGFTFHPAVGYIFRLTEQTPELAIDFGYRFTSHSRTFNSFGSLRTQNNTYRRATLRCNIAF